MPEAFNHTDPIEIRRAHAADQSAIVALVRSERLNPSDLHWTRFVVARRGALLIGAVQLRRHADGALELGSLVVRREERGHNLSARLIDVVLMEVPAPVHVITAAAHAARYARWGFERIPARAAPRSVRRNWLLGQILGGAHSLLQRRAVTRLVILRRARVPA